MVNNGSKLRVVQTNTAGLASSIISQYGNESLIVDVSGPGLYLGNNSTNPIKLFPSNDGKYLSTNGGALTGDLDVSGNIVVTDLTANRNITANEYIISNYIDGNTYLCGNGCMSFDSSGMNFMNQYEDSIGSIEFRGDGKKLLANDLKYKSLKTINGESILGDGNISIEAGNSDANIQAVDTQETIDSVDGFKTINGQSILGSGNIEISGSSSGSGEVYLTPFSVEQFCTGLVELTDEQRNDLINAASQNRIIGMPHSSSYQTGYVISDYGYFSSDEIGSSDWALNLEVIYKGAHYSNVIGSTVNMNFSPGRLIITPFHPLMYFVAVEDGVADVYDNVGYPDNCIYVVNGECSELNIGIEPGGVDYIIKFFTSENCSLYFAYDVCWANGKLPTIEPYTEYELSLSTSINGAFNAVLTKFKSVE